MKVTGEISILQLFREQLIDLSLKTKNEELFDKMTSSDWEKFIIKGGNVEGFKTIGDETSPYLELDFYENISASKADWEKYLDETTLEEDFREKKRKLRELKELSFHLNRNIYSLMSAILKDDELIELLTFTSDRTFRNKVFYMDDKTDKVLIKDESLEIQCLNIKNALEIFKKNKQSYFIEVTVFSHKKENV